MKRFSFKLQRLLDIRARREREAEIALGRALGAQTELENRLKALARESYQAEAERFSPQNNAGDIRVFDLYITRLAAAREDLLREAAQAELAAQEARGAYVAASRDRKVMDKLREKRRAEYRKAVFAGEVRTLDDIPARPE